MILNLNLEDIGLVKWFLDAWDEISPDNCRLWDLLTNKNWIRTFRQDLGDVDIAYKEVAYRLGVLSEKEFKKVLKDDF